MENKNKILIVDDNKTNLDILVHILSDYELTVSTDSENALRLATTENIDLILLDIMMPNLDGFDTCKILKHNNKTKNIPIIFLTAKHDTEDIKKGFELGAVDYITKPFNPTELLVRINTHLKLAHYQKNLEDAIAKELSKNRLQEQIIFQQSKQAEIGELIMHIAHQWKQPLSELSSITTCNAALLKLGNTFDTDAQLENCEKYSNIISFMSNTVETFQNFYKPNDKNSFFDIYNGILKALQIIDATLSYENIELNVEKIESKEVYANQNEFAQVILAILNNAKDIFKLRSIKNPTIDIIIDSHNDKSIITINDNGGGIRLEKRDDIFLPFVSSKNGMGLGLYMAKTIIEKNGGTIKAENIDSGAKFTIII